MKLRYPFLFTIAPFELDTTTTKIQFYYTYIAYRAAPESLYTTYNIVCNQMICMQVPLGAHLWHFVADEQ